MAESYITRRVSSSGSSGSLNIFNGSSPPANSVGVFGQTTNTVDYQYIVPYHGIQTSESPSFVTYENTMPIYNNLMHGTSVGDLVYIAQNMGSKAALYTHDTVSDVYTSIASPSITSHIWTRTMLSSLEYNDGVIYFFGCYLVNETLALRPWAYDIESSTLTYLQNVSMNIYTDSKEPYGNTSGVTGAYFYNNNIYVVISVVTRQSSRTSFLANYIYAFSLIDTPMTILFKQSATKDFNVSNYRSSCWRSGSYIYTSFDNYIYQFDLTTHQYDTYLNNDDEDNAIVSPYMIFKYRQFIYGFSVLGTYSSSVTPYYYDENNSASKIWYYPGQFTLLWPINQTSIAVDTGKRIVLYYIGTGYAMYFDYTNASSFEPNSLIIECSNQQINEAQIVNSDTVNATINVEQVYYSDGTTVSQIPGQVRVDGGQWTAIE